MTHRVALRARADLDEIWLHIARETRSETLADRIVDGITGRFSLLAEYPRLGRARDDDLGRGRRSLPIGDYVILYQIVGANVQILRVAHGRRDLPALSSR
jgi:toxin ParE1/3/4